MPKHRRLKKSDVKEIRIVDRPLDNGRHESTAYILAKGQWYKDVRRPFGPPTPFAEYNERNIIEEFISLQETYERVDGPPDSPDHPSRS